MDNIDKSSSLTKKGLVVEYDSLEDTALPVSVSRETSSNEQVNTAKPHKLMNFTRTMVILKGMNPSSVNKFT